MELFKKLETSFAIEKHIGSQPVNNSHFHSHHELYYLIDGNINYLIGNSVYNIKKGTLIIIPPNTLHKSTDMLSNERTRILISVDKSFVTEFNSAVLECPDVLFYKIQTNSRVHDIFLQLLDETKKYNDIVMQKALLYELLVLLSRMKAQDTVSIDKIMQNTRLSEIISYINAEYASDITLSLLAKKYYTNATYLSRIFKEYTGFTFSEYLNKYRIAKAADVLKTTDKNITETAIATGFNSCNHFCKTFKSIMGVSPLQYKKSII